MEYSLPVVWLTKVRKLVTFDKLGHSVTAVQVITTSLTNLRFWTVNNRALTENARKCSLLLREQLIVNGHHLLLIIPQQLLVSKLGLYKNIYNAFTYVDQQMGVLDNYEFKIRRWAHEVMKRSCKIYNYKDVVVVSLI